MNKDTYLFTSESVSAGHPDKVSDQISDAILDAIFEKETKAKEAAEAVLEQIDLLKKSILARAFRGEL